MLLLLAGISAGTAYGQSDPYGPPGSQGTPGQYGQDPYDDWDQSDDRYDQQSDHRYDDYDSYDRYEGHEGYGRDQAPGVDVGFFYSELSPYGEWVRHRQYGWVWFPRHVRAGWRPYSVGRWVESDYGWTWVSYEPFGWATYHYGRWAWDRRVGWLWVPGTDWAPAWVAWQQGNGYIGWAPLPPVVGFDIRVGIQLGGFNLSFGIAPRNYAFVEERRFLDARIGGYIVPEARNITIINQTTNITNYTVVNNQVINHGVPVERIERATGRRAQRLRVAAATSPRSTGVQRDVINVYRPPASKLESVKVAKRNNAGLRQAERKAVRQEERKAERADAQAAKAKPVAKAPVRRESGPVPIPVAPRAQPAPRKNNERQYAREQENLKRNQEKERRTLEQLQRQEKAQAQAKADAKGVAERHAAEMKAQQEQRQRAAQQLKTRQQIERQAAQASADSARKGQKAQAGANEAKQQQQKKQAELQKAKQEQKQADLQSSKQDKKVKQDKKAKKVDEPKPPQEH